MMYRTLVADPPWPMAWTGGAARRRNGRGEMHSNKAQHQKALPYPTLSIDEIALLNVRDLVEKNAVLFLWAPDIFILDGSAKRVAEAWGFMAQRLFVWRKRGYGLGTFPRPQHEAAVFAKRGSTRPRRFDIGSVQEWKLVYEKTGRSAARKHSAKPPDFLAMIETVFDGPYLELFARNHRLGWSSYGNEVGSDAQVVRILEATS